MNTPPNVKEIVPLFGITNMEASLKFYIDGLGFKMKHCWIPDKPEDHPDGRISLVLARAGQRRADAAGVLERGPSRQYS